MSLHFPSTQIRIWLENCKWIEHENFNWIVQGLLANLWLDISLLKVFDNLWTISWLFTLLIFATNRVFGWKIEASTEIEAKTEYTKQNTSHGFLGTPYLGLVLKYR